LLKKFVQGEKQMIKKFKSSAPRIDESAFVAENAMVIGDVEIGENSSVWYGATIRGDINSVKIGKNTNIQENCVVHVDSNKGNPLFGKTFIGNGVTVGHGAILHGCTIEDDCLIGMGAIVLTGAKIGQGSLIAAGALVRESQEIPPKSVAIGIPAVIKGTVPEDKIELFKDSAKHYVELAEEHKKN